MKPRERQTAKLLSVSESTVGTTLSADAAVGATTLSVDDVSVFDETGSLLIGSQVVAYTAIDDDAGTVTLADPLTAAADTDDAVTRWSTLYGEAETVVSAEVAVLGDRDQADTLTVEVADTIDVVTGDRGRDGENCTIESDGDVWTLVHVSGRPSKARGLKFEADSYTLTGGTGGDIEAGFATIPLTHQPLDESVVLWWRTVAQEPTEYTVDYDAQTITLPLAAFAAAGDRVWVHYAYRRGLAADAPPEPEAVNFTIVGYNGATNNPSTSAVAFPAGTQAGDLFVYACTAPGGYINACPDSRATLRVDSTLPWATPTLRVWVGTVTDPATPLAVSNTGSAGPNFETSWQLMVIRPAAPVDFDASKITDSGGQTTGGVGSIPGLSGVSGAIGVGFSAAGLGGARIHSWPSPWAAPATIGTYCNVSIAAQVNGTVAATPALTTDAWRGFALGVGLG